MSVTYSIDSQISKLTADIFQSAARIRKSKEKDAEKFSSQYQEEAVFSINNFAVSYLNGESLFNVQQISMETISNTANYAYNTYQRSSTLLKNPDILTDFMHKNNRSFDYMV